MCKGTSEGRGLSRGSCRPGLPARIRAPGDVRVRACVRELVCVCVRARATVTVRKHASERASVFGSETGNGGGGGGGAGAGLEGRVGGEEVHEQALVPRRLDRPQRAQQLRGTTKRYGHEKQQERLS